MRNKTIGVYMITCTENNKCYIGSSRNIEKRWLRHKEDLKKGTHFNKHLQSAWIKYTQSSFVFSILEYCLIESLLDKEGYWINLLQTCQTEKGYNICQPGDYPKLPKNNIIIANNICRESTFIYSISTTCTTKTTRKEAIKNLGISETKMGNVLRYWSNYFNNIKKGEKSWHGYIFVREADYNQSFDYLSTLGSKKTFKQNKIDWKDPVQVKDYQKEYDKKKTKKYLVEQL